VRLRVLLVNPPRVQGLPVVREERYEHRDMGSVYPPLSLLQAAASLRAEGVDVQVLDANGFDLPLVKVSDALHSFEPHVVVTRLAFDCQEEDLKVLQAAKGIAPHAITVVRCRIVSDVPDLLAKLAAKAEVDLCLTGEPDSVLPLLAKSLAQVLPSSGPLPVAELRKAAAETPGLAWSEDGALRQSAQAPLTDVTKTPFPAYDLLPSVRPYHTGVFPDHFAMIQTSRGCPFGCAFCAYAQERHRPRPAQSVCDEIRWLRDTFGVKNLLFFDDVLSIQAKASMELTERMVQEKLGVHWVCCTRANLTDVPSLQMMRSAGCQELAVGIESGSETILKNIHKGITKDEMRECAAACKKADILFYGMTIVGLPGETRETLRETVDFIKELDPFYTQFCFSTPFPNTDMYGWYKERGLLLHEDWARYSPLAQEPVVRTEALTAEDLKTLRRQAYREVIFRPKYLLSKIRWTDPVWTLQGACKIAGRGLALLSGKSVR